MLRRISEFRAECQRLFHYNPYTGELRNRVRRAQRAKVGELAGTVGTGGYRITAILDKSFTVHRLIFLMMAGYLPEQVDHINGVRDDNRWENLRAVDQSGNSKNARMPSRNTTGVVGVALHPLGYQAYIGSGARRLNKFYKTLEEAIAWRKSKELELGYHENHGRAM